MTKKETITQIDSLRDELIKLDAKDNPAITDWQAFKYESSNVYDLDNCLKAFLDCLQYTGAITNDNLCIGIKDRPTATEGRVRH